MDRPTYATDLELRRRAGLPAAPTATADLVEHLDTASRAAEELTGYRCFYPTLETRSLDWPDRAGTQTDSSKYWLGEDELTTVSQLLVNGVAWTEGTDYRLWPANDSPKRAIETLPAANRYFTTGSQEHAGAVALTAEFGYTNAATSITTLAAAVVSSTATAMTVTDGANVGIGAALKLGSEWVIVDGVSWVDAADTLAGAMVEDIGLEAITVTDSSLYAIGETLLVDAERMTVADILSSTSIHVERAVDGSSPTDHSSGAQIRALRGLTVTRGALGTAGAAHSLGATVARLVPPPLVRDYTLAAAQVAMAQTGSSFAREIGAGESAREASHKGLAAVEKRLKSQLSMPARFRASGDSTLQRRHRGGPWPNA